MRKLIVTQFITLDGVIQAPGAPDEDTDGGFRHGGWTLPLWHDDIGKHFLEAADKADAFLLGRKTWQEHGASFDPMPAGDPFGDVMNSRAKYVVSTTLRSADAWRNSTLIKSNVVDEVRRLKAQPGKDILLDGSSVLIKTLIDNDLVDEYALHVYPLVLGPGKRLFATDKRLDLKLVHFEQLPTGVVFQRYVPAS